VRSTKKVKSATLIRQPGETGTAFIVSFTAPSSFHAAPEEPFFSLTCKAQSPVFFLNFRLAEPTKVFDLPFRLSTNAASTPPTSIRMLASCRRARTQRRNSA